MKHFHSSMLNRHATNTKLSKVQFSPCSGDMYRISRLVLRLDDILKWIAGIMNMKSYYGEPSE